MVHITWSHQNCSRPNDPKSNGWKKLDCYYYIGGEEGSCTVFTDFLCKKRLRGKKKKGDKWSWHEKVRGVGVVFVCVEAVQIDWKRKIQGMRMI